MRKFKEFRDSVVCFTNFMGKYPQGIDFKLYEYIDIMGSFHNVLVHENKFSKIKTTPIATKILKALEDKIDGGGNKNNLKFLGLSGHDGTLLPFLSILNITDSDCLLRKLKGGYIDDGSEWCLGNPPFAS